MSARAPHSPASSQGSHGGNMDPNLVRRYHGQAQDPSGSHGGNMDPNAVRYQQARHQQRSDTSSTFEKVRGQILSAIRMGGLRCRIADTTITVFAWSVFGQCTIASAVRVQRVRKPSNATDHAFRTVCPRTVWAPAFLLQPSTTISPNHEPRFYK